MEVTIDSVEPGGWGWGGIHRQLQLYCHYCYFTSFMVGSWEFIALFNLCDSINYVEYIKYYIMKYFENKRFDKDN